MNKQFTCKNLLIGEVVVSNAFVVRLRFKLAVAIVALYFIFVFSRYDLHSYQI